MRQCLLCSAFVDPKDEHWHGSGACRRASLADPRVREKPQRLTSRQHAIAKLREKTRDQGVPQAPLYPRVTCPGCRREVVFLITTQPYQEPICHHCFAARETDDGVRKAARAVCLPGIMPVVAQAEPPASRHYTIIDVQRYLERCITILRANKHTTSRPHEITSNYHWLHDLVEGLAVFYPQQSQEVLAFEAFVAERFDILATLRPCPARSRLEAQSYRDYEDYVRRIEKQHLDTRKPIDALIASLSTRIDAAFAARNNHLPAPEMIDWELLPAGAHPFHHILGYYHRLQHERPDMRYDLTRLAQIVQLKPDRCYIAKGRLVGYIAFYFAACQTAVLEHPVEGNAIYILRGNWETLSRYSKADLGSPRHMHTNHTSWRLVRATQRGPVAVK